MKCFQVDIHMSGSSTSAVAVIREKRILICFMALMVSSWEAAKRCQMVLKELFLMILFLLLFPRSRGQHSIGPIYTWEVVGHEYFCSVTNANPQLKRLLVYTNKKQAQPEQSSEFLPALCASVFTSLDEAVEVSHSISTGLISSNKQNA